MKTNDAQGDLFAATSDPLRYPCTYAGYRYALPCRAGIGEPCCWPGVTPPERYHAERRVAAGERLKSADERLAEMGLPTAEADDSGEDEPEDDEADE